MYDVQCKVFFLPTQIIHGILKNKAIASSVTWELHISVTKGVPRIKWCENSRHELSHGPNWTYEVIRHLIISSTSELNRVHRVRMEELVVAEHPDFELLGNSRCSVRASDRKRFLEDRHQQTTSPIGRLYISIILCLIWTVSRWTIQQDRLNACKMDEWFM